LKYDIYISDYNKTKVLQLPIIPTKLPSLSKSISNEEFTTYWNGTYNFIEKPGLSEFTIDRWLPGAANKYSFARSQTDPLEYINLLESARDNAEPIRVVISCSDGSTYVNDSFSIEKFEYNINKRSDYDYSLSVKQYRAYTSSVSSTTTAGWQQDSTGWYYYYDDAGNYYRDTWKSIENEWYSFDAGGYARQSVWIDDGGYWYYLKDSCKMARNEWVTIDGKSYYLGDQGGMYANCYTPDGYWVNSSGEWVP
jgi:hypothetical protein